MNRQDVFSYIEDQYGVRAEYPFREDRETCVFRHAGSRKWFAICMRVSARRLGRDSDETVEIMNVKADPLVIGSFHRKKGFYPAYHMNKTHWITIFLDGEADREDVSMLIDMSFSLTNTKRSR